MKFPASRQHIVLVPSKKGKVALVDLSRYGNRSNWSGVIVDGRQLSVTDFLHALAPQIVSSAVDHVTAQLTNVVVRRIRRGEMM